MSGGFIRVRGARTHNLKNCSLDIPKNQLVVFTGVSGSGKSSLAFDTIWAEGQRKYLESLSTYARMVASSISEDTEVDEITGLSPTISISQKTVSQNPRSTVGTITEIYDFYRLLFTTIGKRYCPNHPNVELKQDTVTDVVEWHIAKLTDGVRFLIASPFKMESGIYTQEAVRERVIEAGFLRFLVDGTVYSAADAATPFLATVDTPLAFVVDRLVVPTGEETERGDFWKRCRDSVETAFAAGSDRLIIRLVDTGEQKAFCRSAACNECGFVLEDLTISHFSFNSPAGACEACHGLGTRYSFDEANVVNVDLSLSEGAILPWSTYTYYPAILRAMCEQHGIPYDAPYKTLTPEQRKLVLYGAPWTITAESTFDPKNPKMVKTRYEGVIPNLERRMLDNAENAEMTKRIREFMTEAPCPDCGGARLKPQSLAVRVGGKNIAELCTFSVRESLAFHTKLIAEFSSTEREISKQIFKNVIDRLTFLDGVGLGYVTLSRRTATLSGGESQRIRLATQIGTQLEGIIYVLDEPSIGLHSADNDRLIANIRKLVDIGNTVIVVEHDDEVMLAADYLVDIGPGAGEHGGEVIFAGTPKELMASANTDTAAYLSGKKRISMTSPTLPSDGVIHIQGARGNNLKNLTVDIPLSRITVVTGVSGSGKSTLVMDTLAVATERHFNGSAVPVAPHKTITGLDKLDKAIVIDQSPIGRTPHSNVATYTGVFTAVREVFAASLEAQKRGYWPGRFSFNTRGGRCEACEGTGVKRIEMHFLPDVFVPCEVCNGKRYNRETLEVRFKGKTISEVLDMTIEDALEFFSAFPRIKRVLSVLFDVGLGYIRLGQSAPTLSGGEAQRIKLAFDLARPSTTRTLYILDEPTTGLHFSDVQNLLTILASLRDRGNTIVVIEHHLDVIANADYLIDIGPSGGDEGGMLVYSGDPKGITKCKNSLTGKALLRHAKRHIG